jgi:hypothetical protein
LRKQTVYYKRYSLPADGNKWARASWQEASSYHAGIPMGSAGEITQTMIKSYSITLLSLQIPEMIS